MRLKPDLIVVPECEHPDNFSKNSSMPRPTDALWFGDSKHKGVGIFSYSQLQFRLLENYNPVFKYVIPIAVTGGNFDFILFAIWANNVSDPKERYIAQVWKAIHYYKVQLSNSTCILAGDFNSNTIWDKPRRKENHSSVVSLLKDHGILSSYHTYHNLEQGKEKHPTFYLYRHRDKPYHIDYCFASAKLIDRIKSIEIGKHRTWMKFSDHVPLSVAFE